MKQEQADTLVKVVLVFFFALIAFSFGTFVGKTVSDSDHDRMRQQSRQAERDEQMEEFTQSDARVDELKEALAKTERDYAEAAEIHKINTDHKQQPCTQYNLSPKQQMDRVNEILGTPTEKKVGQP